MEKFDARVMRFASFLLIISCLIAVTANTQNEKEKRIILEQNSLLKMDISTDSRNQFKMFMSGFCLNDMTSADFLVNYIRWENVEFLDSVRDFLDPTHTADAGLGAYFHHLGHDFNSNCSFTNDTRIRDSHDQVNDEALFDNYMYDRMTRHQWTGINL